MSKWTEICSQGSSTEISHGMGQNVIFQASCVCCNLLYMSNGKGIITKVTSACPLRKEVTLLPSPFCVRFEKKQIGLYMSERAWKLNNCWVLLQVWYVAHLGINILLSRVSGTPLHFLLVVRHWQPGQGDLQRKDKFHLPLPLSIFSQKKRLTWTEPWSASTRFTQWLSEKENVNSFLISQNKTFSPICPLIATRLVWIFARPRNSSSLLSSS